MSSYSNTACPTVTFAYDRMGRVGSAATAVSSNLFEYAGLDLVGEVQNGVTVTRAYDNLGRIAGFNMGSAYIAAYGYDTFGRFASVSSSVATASSVANYSYVAGADLVASMTNSSGFSWSRVYEQNRDLIAGVENGFGGNTVSVFVYGNDANGRRWRRVDSGSVTNLFGHNACSEVVTTLMGADAYGYGYDPIGNRLFSAFNTETNTYFTNPLNQYTNITGGVTVTPVHDADGNMISCGLWSYTWDAENRLVAAYSNNVCVVTNVYDHQSRRIVKVTSAETRTFIWDGWNPVLETVLSAGGVSTNRYLWGLDLSGTLQGAGGVGGLLAVIEGDGSMYFPRYDTNGNIMEYAATNGGGVASRGYDPFGNTTAATGPKIGDFTFWWSTKPFDAETGLAMYQLRPYSPPLGRWLSRDPIEEEGGLNLFGFIGNSAITRNDELGLRTCCCPETGKNCESSNTYEWRGQCSLGALGAGKGRFGISGWNLTCHLISTLLPNCKQYSVDIDAYGELAAWSLKLPVSATLITYPIGFSGNPKTPEDFQGFVMFAGGGVGLWKGLSLSWLKIGKASAPLSLTVTTGVDIPNISGGVSTLNNVTWREWPCRSWNRLAPYFP